MHRRIPGGSIVLVLTLLTMVCLGLGNRAYNLQEAEQKTRTQLAQERESSENLRKTWLETSSQLMAATQELATARQQLGHFERENGNCAPRIQT